MRSVPVFLRPDMVRAFIENGDVYYEEGQDHAVWFGQILPFSEGQRHCWQVLWRNFLKGNLPMAQGRVLSTWGGKCSQVSDIFKRHPGWKTVIVGDGKGHLWLTIPARRVQEVSANSAALRL
jgi:hypothetical protein